MVAVVTLSGHLTRERLAESLSAVPSDRLRHGLVLDCLAMRSYDLDARQAFVEWAKEQRYVVHGVAIVTANTVWHMVIRAMSLASRVPMRPFESLADAHDWLAEQHPMRLDER